MATEKRLIDANVFADHLERMTKTTYPNLLPGLLEAAEYARDFIPTVDAVEVVRSYATPDGYVCFGNCENKITTNEDRFLAMSVPEKAEFFVKVVSDGCPPAHDWDCKKDEDGWDACAACWARWLKQPAEGD